MPNKTPTKVCAHPLMTSGKPRMQAALTAPTWRSDADRALCGTPTRDTEPFGQTFQRTSPAAAQPAQTLALCRSADDVVLAIVDAEQTSFEPPPRRALLI